jgi:hypothetical protein
MQIFAEFILEAIENSDNKSNIASVAAKVENFSAQFTLAAG